MVVADIWKKKFELKIHFDITFISEKSTYRNERMGSKGKLYNERIGGNCKFEFKVYFSGWIYLFCTYQLSKEILFGSMVEDCIT